MTTITFIPTDFTGTALGNRRSNEVHHLITVAGKTNRAFVCNHGAFYSASMIARDNTGRLLVQGTDYKTVYHYEDFSTLTGKEVMGFVVVTNAAVQSPVTIQYQALGGPFAVSVDELRVLLEAIDDTKFPFVWGEIIGKPTAYKPKPHTHQYWQLYGLETTVTEIDRIANAWAIGNKAVMAENETYTDAYIASAQAEIAKYQAAVTAHIQNYTNPHNLTPAQVQRERLFNWGMSGVFHIADPANNNTYLPIGGVYQILNDGIVPLLNAHLRNYNNPHGVTPDMADVYTAGYVDNQLASKLKWTDYAANSTLFSGIDHISLYNQARLAIPAGNVTSGLFQWMQLGTDYPGFDTENYLLAGDKTWKHWSQFMKVINDTKGRVAYIGLISGTKDGEASGAVAARNILNASFASTTAWPVGSMALAQFAWRYYELQIRQVLVFQRTAATGWTYLA
ncbi:virion structural protein [Pseudomonas phage Psa21]|uniref:Virion structural protein n=1 Tax=Pseudomonas phage Psa21 TaxID=2530023 RepID=A0A481W5R2_9CAUD|nr:virion structural protein [Pseudomonas phage Psa21]QBJ02714.1 virion structural protein [Pseudomonas phage Psa21]